MIAVVDATALGLAVVSGLFVCFALVAFGLWLAGRRPLTPTEEFCARVDEELDREVIAGGGFRVGPRRDVGGRAR